MDKLKYIKLKNEDGSYSESIPLSVDGQYVDINGQSLTNKINTLATKDELSAVASGSPAGVYNTVSALTTADPNHSKIYVVTEDGCWYYYNNGWQSGGVYQAIQIDDSDETIIRIDDSLGNESIGDPTYINKVIRTNGSVVDLNTLWPISDFKCWVLDCQEGDVFTITGTGGDTPRLYAFIDANNNNLLKAPSRTTVTQLAIIAPENASKLIINVNGSAIIYKGRSVDNRIDSANLGYFNNLLSYKEDNELSIGDIINADSENEGLYDAIDKTIYVSSNHHYNVYTVEEGKKYYITGRAGGNAVRYPFLIIFDKDDNIIYEDGTTVNNKSYYDKLIEIPKHGVKAIVNGLNWQSSQILLKDSVLKIDNYVENVLPYKMNCNSTIGETIEADSENNGLYDIINKTVYASDVSHYNIYTVEDGKRYYVTGKTPTNASAYSLLGIYDSNNNLLLKYGIDSQTAYTDVLVEIPKNGTKMIVNGASIETSEILLKEAIPDYSSILQPSLPAYVKNNLSYKQLGVLSKPYVMFFTDDGLSQLATNTIPNIIQAVYNETGVKVPFTFALMHDSPIFNNDTYTQTVKDMITNYRCDVALHGSNPYTDFTNEQDLSTFLDNEIAFLSSKGINAHGVVYPYHYSNVMVKYVCGGYFNVCMSGTSTNRIYGFPRVNIYNLPRISIYSTDLATLKQHVDTAYENNYLLSFFFHDKDMTSAEYIEKAKEIIKYCITKGMNFCNIGEVVEKIF